MNSKKNIIKIIVVVVAITLALIIILSLLNKGSKKEPLEGYYRYTTSNPAGTHFIREIEIRKDKTATYAFGEYTNEKFSDVKITMKYKGTYKKAIYGNITNYTVSMKSTDKNCVDGKYKCKEKFLFQRYTGDEHLYLVLDTTAPQYNKVEKPIILK